MSWLSEPWMRGASQTLSELGVELSSEQYALYFNPARFKIGMGGERGGKSFLSAMYLVGRMLSRRPLGGGLYWLVGLDYWLARPEFIHIQQALTLLGLVDPKNISTPSEGTWVLETIFGDRIESKSGTDVQKIAGFPPDGIVGCEIANWPPELFRRVTDRTGEKRGWFIGTGSYEGSLGWLPEKVAEWGGPNESDAFASPIPSWSNLFVYPGGWDDPEIQRLRSENPDARFNERFGGVPHPPTGRVFSDARNSLHIRNDLPYERDHPVYLAIDPGYGSAYAVLAIQLLGIDHNFVNIFDELYLQRHTHTEVINAARTLPWWRDVSYAVMDIAGRQHHADRSADEVWSIEGKIQVYSQKVGIRDGIERTHTFLRIDPSPASHALRWPHV